MLALLGFFPGSVAAGEALVAGSEVLGGRKLSSLAGSDPSVASNLAAAVRLTSGGAGADSTLGPASTRCAGKFGCFTNDTDWMWAGEGCRGAFLCNGHPEVPCGDGVTCATSAKACRAAVQLDGCPVGLFACPSNPKECRASKKDCHCAAADGQNAFCGWARDAQGRLERALKVDGDAVDDKAKCRYFF